MDIQSPTVGSLLEDISHGRIVLPDFQREFVWNSEDVKDLLVSVLADYYIGTMLYMESIANEAPFSIRLVNGVAAKFPEAKANSIVQILLDGQQRCSSLFYAAFEPTLPLHGRKNPHRFALNIPAALEEKWDKAVEYYNPNMKKQVEKYASEDFIHFRDFLDTTALVNRLVAGKWKDSIDKIFAVVNRFNQFKIQMVKLKQNTPLDRVVEIFERINRTGMPLDITDLLVARQFKSGTNLRDLIETSKQTYEFLNESSNIDPEFILRVMCLMRHVEIRKDNILNLDSKNFQADWTEACDRLEEAYRLITNVQTGFGAIELRRFIPFKTMIIPLAYLLHFLRQNNLRTKSANDKIAEWYWVSVFNNRYNEAVNTLTFSDVDKMRNWIQNDVLIPDFIKRFNPEAMDFYVTSKASSTYRGILCCIIRAGALDFVTGKDPLQELNRLQDDHIFPKAGFIENSILNRTLISTNAEKSNQLPGKYFEALETVHRREGLLKILATHLMDANCFEALRNNDIDSFKRARRHVFLNTIRTLTPNSTSAIDHMEADTVS